ncbi:S-protein homolog 2-like [Olea europaea var. sylvestris]|uniref:S-protein homolog 2-like n=1 Tax=Olea europaea var. sylvestris TaxID=158386 RepID=UPI000C1CF0C7|nr:S-protein homolog 2-like [Olea europaea var. sylvestris]
MKIIFTLFIVLFLLAQELCAFKLRPFHLTNGYDVHVVNGLPDSPNPLWVHCASKDNELGTRILHVNEDFHWHFFEGVFGETLFFCHFWWGSKQMAFDVFKNPTDCERGDPKADHNQCYWVVKADGFYFSKINPPSPSDLKKRNDWA